MAGLKLILIDANLAFAGAAKAFLGAMDEVAEVRTARTLKAALNAMSSGDVDIVIADASALGWERTRAIECLRSVSSARSQLVLLSLDDSREARNESLGAGADVFLGKAEFGERLPEIMTSLLRSRSPVAEI